MNKDSERFYLDKFRQNVANFPPGEILSDERPDFLIKGPGVTTGIEVTNFFSETSGTPLQQRESIWAQIMDLAQSTD